MFFEPPPAGPDPVARGLPEVPPWAGQPALERGAVVAVERIVARSANIVIVLPTIRAYGTGCMFDVEVIGRQGTLSSEPWPSAPRRSRLVSQSET